MANTVYYTDPLFEEHRPRCTMAYVNRPVLVVWCVRLKQLISGLTIAFIVQFSCSEKSSAFIYHRSDDSLEFAFDSRVVFTQVRVPEKKCHEPAVLTQRCGNRVSCVFGSTARGAVGATRLLGRCRVTHTTPVWRCSKTWLLFDVSRVLVSFHPDCLNEHLEAQALRYHGRLADQMTVELCDGFSRPENNGLSGAHSLRPPRLVVLYGSQTGLSRSVAERLVSQAYYLFSTRPSPVSSLPTNQSVNLLVSLCPLDSYTPINRLAKECDPIVFVCSTTGYGVPPDNMCQFWRRLMSRNLPVGRALPTNLRFAVLGLGDSSYPKFNIVAKKLYRRLVQLGATPLPIFSPVGDSSTDCGLGLADEQAELGVNSVMNWWVPRLWTVLSDYWHLPFVTDCAPIPLTYSFLESPPVLSNFWPTYDVTLAKPVPTFAFDGDADSRNFDNISYIADWDCEFMFKGHPFPSSSQWFRVLRNERITAAGHFQDTRLISLSSCE
ncbi:NADPH-dependent diflavin oxidoreductase 1, partial [Clonorchis sinensis]